MKEDTKRLQWIDTLKGFAIILVVLGHTLDGSLMYNTSNWMINLHTIIYAFHMPLFFFLSGCTFALSKKNTDTKLFFSRMLELLIVYIFWSFLMYFGKKSFANEVNNPLSHSFFYHLLFSPVAPFWYLITLIMYSVLTFIIKGNKKLQYILFIVALLISGIIPIFTFWNNSKELSFLYRLFFHFVFFLGGFLFIRKNCTRKVSLSRRIIVYCITLFSIIIYCVFNLYNKLMINEVLAWLFIVTFIMICMKLSKIFTPHILNYYGHYSLYIYCLHNFCTVALRILLKNTITNGGEYVCIVFLTTMIICTFAIIIIQKIKFLNIFFMPAKTIVELRKSREN